jgi:acyl-CoA thioesterase
MVENKGINDKLFNYIVSTINKTPYNNLLGIRPYKIGEGFVELIIKSEKKHLNENHDHDPVGILHGGLLLSLADAIMGNAVRTLGTEVVTVDCSTKFVSLARLGDTIVGRGRVIKAGRKMYFTDADMMVDDRLVAAAYGTFYKVGEYCQSSRGVFNNK